MNHITKSKLEQIGHRFDYKIISNNNSQYRCSICGIWVTTICNELYYGFFNAQWILVDELFTCEEIKMREALE